MLAIRKAFANNHHRPLLIAIPVGVPGHMGSREGDNGQIATEGSV